MPGYRREAAVVRVGSEGAASAWRHAVAGVVVALVGLGCVPADEPPTEDHDGVEAPAVEPGPADAEDELAARPLPEDAAGDEADEPEPDPTCEPAYPDICVPPAGDPDPVPALLTCADLDVHSFPVSGEDPYVFDANGDGIGCTPEQAVPMDPACDPDLHEPFPAEVALMFARLALPDGLCLRRYEDPEAASRDHALEREVFGFYDAGRRVAAYTAQEDRAGELGIIIHELCHAHQHQAALEDGRPMEDYLATPEGQAFLSASIESEMLLVNLEAAVFPCQSWYAELTGLRDLRAYDVEDPGGDGDPGPLQLERFPPLLAWAEQWFPVWPWPTDVHGGWPAPDQRIDPADTYTLSRSTVRALDPFLRTSNRPIDQPLTCRSYVTHLEAVLVDGITLTGAAGTFEGQLVFAHGAQDTGSVEELLSFAHGLERGWFQVVGHLEDLGDPAHPEHATTVDQATEALQLSKELSLEVIMEAPTASRTGGTVGGPALNEASDRLLEHLNAVRQLSCA